MRLSKRAWTAENRAPKTAAAATSAPSTRMATNGGWKRVDARRTDTRRLRRMHVMPAARPQSAVAAGVNVHTDRYPRTFGFDAEAFGAA